MSTPHAPLEAAPAALPTFHCLSPHPPALLSRAEVRHSLSQASRGPPWGEVGHRCWPELPSIPERGSRCAQGHNVRRGLRGHGGECCLRSIPWRWRGRKEPEHAGHLIACHGVDMGFAQRAQGPAFGSGLPHGAGCSGCLLAQSRRPAGCGPRPQQQAPSNINRVPSIRSRIVDSSARREPMRQRASPRRWRSAEDVVTRGLGPPEQEGCRPAGQRHDGEHEGSAGRLGAPCGFEVAEAALVERVEVRLAPVWQGRDGLECLEIWAVKGVSGEDPLTSSRVGYCMARGEATVNSDRLPAWRCCQAARRALMGWGGCSDVNCTGIPRRCSPACPGCQRHGAPPIVGFSTAEAGRTAWACVGASCCCWGTAWWGARQPERNARRRGMASLAGASRSRLYRHRHGTP